MDKLAEISHGAKVVLGSAIALLIVSFFNWQEVKFGGFSSGISMWHGIGVVAGLFIIALIAWQAVRLANIKLELGVTPSMITAVLAILTFVFVLITFLSHNEYRTWAAWVGLILSIVIVGGAWANMKAAGEGFAEVKASASALGSSAKSATSSSGSSAEGGAPDAAPSAPAETPPAEPSGDDAPKS